MVADRYGGKDILGFAVLWWSAATLVAPVARTVPLMITARIGFGIGESVTPSVLYSMTALWIPASERSRVVAFDLTCVYLGLMIAFPIALRLITTWGWEPWRYQRLAFWPIIRDIG